MVIKTIISPGDIVHDHRMLWSLQNIAGRMSREEKARQESTQFGGRSKVNLLLFE